VCGQNTTSHIECCRPDCKPFIREAEHGTLQSRRSDRDGRFRAFDSKTGQEIWSAKLEYSAQCIPITYRGKDGKQYVAVIAAAPIAGQPNNRNESLVAFALP